MCRGAKKRARASAGSGAGHSGEKPAGRGDADGGEKLALQNPALVVCEKDGEQVLLKVRPDRRENFRPHLTTGAPMTVQARWVIGNLYVIEGACPRFPGRW